MRFGFVTCVQLGLSCMEEIYELGGRLGLVVTLEDNQAREKSGRVYVDDFCERHAIDLVKVRNINDQDALQAVRDHRVVWLFVIGWSQIVKEPMLASLGRGGLGMHPTLLPIGRGRAAIPWAILKGLPETGVTLFIMDEGVDTGSLLGQYRLPLASDETATSLYRRVAEAHRLLIREIWDDLVADRARAVPQDHSRATVWPGRKPEDGRITADMGVMEVERLVRATTHPYPGAFWEDPDRIVRIWRGRIAGESSAGGNDTLRIPLRDGVYEALEYDVEPSARTEKKDR